MSAMGSEHSSVAQLHAVVHRDVQGVGFRYFVERQAREAGLTGWVQNRPDGTVECLAEGDRAALLRLLEDLQRGPGAAEVDSVEAAWGEPEHDFRAFGVRG